MENGQPLNFLQFVNQLVAKGGDRRRMNMAN